MTTLIYSFRLLLPGVLGSIHFELYASRYALLGEVQTSHNR